jgi:hypothetical protein
MKVEGGCHCGAIAYEAVVDPQSAGLCHCSDCQTLSGARRAQAFCAGCGTPIYTAAVDNPTQSNLRPGAITQRPDPCAQAELVQFGA